MTGKRVIRVRSRDEGSKTIPRGSPRGNDDRGGQGRGVVDRKSCREPRVGKEKVGRRVHSNCVRATGGHVRTCARTRCSAAVVQDTGQDTRFRY